MTPRAPESPRSAEAEVAALTAILVTDSAQPPSNRSITRLLRGSVFRTTPDPRGTVHWVRPGEIVLYTVHAHEPRTFVFRTPTSRASQILTRVPGVSPAVVLLVQTTTLGRQVLVHRLFRQLGRARRDPSHLPDVFYSKLHTVLARRAPNGAAINSLLLQTHDPSP
jgi:hypothetical protein